MFAPVYLDHNATTPLHAAVREAMLPWLGERYGNASSRHEYGRAARKAIDEARAQVAAAVNAHPTEVIFTSGGSEANNLFIKGAAVPQDSREQVSRRISQESMERFLNSVTIDFGRIENPVAYLQTSLYTYHQKLLQPSQAEPVSTGTSEQPLADWELEWLERVKAKRHSQETE